ncbi:hypothetical protein [Clostridium sp.]|uniref:hypothetical protein n=1 Tax=Clostridium sp. TaxID=1506 RepID=UPI003F3CE518
MGKSKSEDIRIPISFKRTAEELSIYNFIKDNSSVIGQSNFIKLLVIEEMKRKGVWMYN